MTRNNPHDPDDPSRFLRHDALGAWADLERVHYLRQLAYNIQQRLEELYKHPYRNAECIAREQIALESVQQELEQLEPPSCVY